MYPSIDVENTFAVFGKDLCNACGIGYRVSGLWVGHGFDGGVLPSVAEGVHCLKHFLGLVLGMLRAEDAGNSSLEGTIVPIDRLPYLFALVLVRQSGGRCMYHINCRCCRAPGMGVGDLGFEEALALLG